MAKTYTPIATTTMTSPTASIAFSSIPQTYTDLVLVVSANGSRPSLGGDIRCQLNSDTGTNYSNTLLQCIGSSTWNERASSQTYANLANNIGILGSVDYTPTIINFMNYSNTTTYKTILTRHSGVVSANVQARVTLWRSTSAISTIYLWNEAGAIYNFNPGSTFTLYGILKA
jgi:hypothetical protein